MILALNTSDRDLELYYGGVSYQLPIGEPVEIPELVAQLYFGYGLDITEDLANLCISRLKNHNHSISGLPNATVWDNYIQKVEFNLDVISKQKEIKKSKSEITVNK